MIHSKSATALLMAFALISAQACTTDQVIDGTVNTAGVVTKTVAKGAVGAGKLAVKGVKNATGSGDE